VIQAWDGRKGQCDAQCANRGGLRVIRELRLSVAPLRLGICVAALAAMLAPDPPSIWGTVAAAATSDPAAQVGGSICSMVDGAAAANRLPADFLLRILWQESRLRNQVTSPAGAEGIAQFMPRTAAERGLADPRDPAPAIGAAARLLADLKIQFGNLGLAAAAYNAGAGRVIKWLRRQSDLPAETHLYVAAVTGRPVEEWSSPAGARQMSSWSGDSCLAVMPDLMRSSLARTASPGWGSRPNRDFAQAFGVVAPAPRQPDFGLQSLRASLALCDRIRLLGSRCAVY
jgi:hypothetical protein